jgi:hypothetical protein
MSSQALKHAWLKPSISDSEVAIYLAIQLSEWTVMEKSGVALLYTLIRDGLPFKTQSDLMNNTLGLENCMVEILRPKTKELFIFCAYRAPNNPVENYITELENVIHKLPNNSEFILLGDFNIDL